MKKVIALLFCAMVLVGCTSTKTETAAPTITPTTEKITVKVGEEIDLATIFTAKDADGNELEVKLIDGAVDTSKKMVGKTTEYFVQAVDSNKQEVRATLNVTVEE